MKSGVGHRLINKTNWDHWEKKLEVAGQVLLQLKKQKDGEETIASREECPGLHTNRGTKAGEPMDSETDGDKLWVESFQMD